jgi:hypothetical protein
VGGGITTTPTVPTVNVALQIDTITKREGIENGESKLNEATQHTTSSKLMAETRKRAEGGLNEAGCSMQLARIQILAQRSSRQSSAHSEASD